MDNFNNIPYEMRTYRQWILWRAVMDESNGKWSKIPINPHTGWNASTTAPHTWADFDTCVNLARDPSRGVNGIGFVFADSDPYCGIDLDATDDLDCQQKQRFVYDKIGGYAEFSPSGRGLHIITRAQVPHGRRKYGIEVYSNQRFFTMTGNIYRNAQISYEQDNISDLWEDLTGTIINPNAYVGDINQNHHDYDIWNMAANAANGDLFRSLWYGDSSGYPSPSEADFALIDIIAFYTQNRIQIARLFMFSERGKRDKYATASQYRLNTLLGYMINKSFDRMLPPVDMSGVIDQINAAQQLYAESSTTQVDACAVQAPTRYAQPTNLDPTGHSYGSSGGGMMQSTTPINSPQCDDDPDIELWRRKFPPGVLGELVSHVMRSSPRPVYEIALTAALGILSGMCGRAYNVSGTGLNHYLVLLAKTGTGKDVITSLTSKIFTEIAEAGIPAAADFAGPADISSGQGLIRHLSGRSVMSCVSTIGEVGLRFTAPSNGAGNSADISLRRVLLDLYGRSGAGQTVRPTVYSDSTKNTDTIHSPAYSFVGESTPETFYRNFDDEAVNQGLMPRFTIIEYLGPRVPYNVDHAESKYMPPDLKGRMLTLSEHVLTLMAGGKYINIGLSNDAKHALAVADQYADDRLNASNDEASRHLWNRYHLKIMKMASILAVAVNPFNPVVNAELVEWARSLVHHDVTRLIGKYERGEMGTVAASTEQASRMIRAIRDYMTAPAPNPNYTISAAMARDTVFTFGYLQKRLAKLKCFASDRLGAALAIKSAIQTLIDSGAVGELNKAQLANSYGYSGRGFYVNNPTYFYASD